MNDMIDSKLKLPKIGCIGIESISNCNKKLKKFLKDFAPSKLDSIKILCESDTDMDFYLDSITEAIESVCKEVCLKGFNINEQELEMIIKCAYKSEEIIISNCDLSCPKVLDFNIYSKYESKILRIQKCKFTGDSGKVSEWSTIPPALENIVESIGKCTLKLSLEKFYIDNGRDISKDEVQLLFNKNGMENVIVVQDSINESIVGGIFNKKKKKRKRMKLSE